MKKFVVLLILLSMSKVAVAYAADPKPTSRSFVSGSTVQGLSNLNQVLVLLTGKDGKPGPAGVAGPRGLMGINGKTGIPGIQGAPGVAGKDGTQGATGPAGPQGLAGATGPAGADGVAGASGASGAQGAQGPAGAKGDRGDAGGGGGGGSLSYGAGEVSVGACSDSATVGLKAKFTSGDFVFDTITVNDLNTDCGGLTFKYYFEIKATGSLHNSTGEYANGATIECTFAIPASGTWGTNPQFSIGSGNSTCTNLTAPRSPVTTFLLNKISTADYTDAIGFEIT